MKCIYSAYTQLSLGANNYISSISCTTPTPASYTKEAYPNPTYAVEYMLGIRVKVGRGPRNILESQLVPRKDKHQHLVLANANEAASFLPSSPSSTLHTCVLQLQQHERVAVRLSYQPPNLTCIKMFRPMV